MKFKKISLILLFGISFSFAGFFSHDKAYYDEHPNDAKEKNSLCEKAIETALKNGDMKLAEKYSKDEECKAAHDAYTEKQEKIRKAKEEAREKKEKEERAKKEAAFKTEYDKQYQIFKEADYKKYIELGAKDCRLYIRSGLGGELSAKDAKCQAWNKLKPQKEKEEIARLLKEYPHEKIFEYKKKILAQRNYGDPYTDLVVRAADQETKNQIDFYLAHKDKLKHDFNDCYYKFEALNKKAKYNEAAALKESYKCNMSARAALKLGINGYFKPMK